MSTYQPPIALTPELFKLTSIINEQLGRLSERQNRAQALRLRRISRIQTIHGSLAIEGNSLSLEQITAVLEGKPVIAPPREVQEVKNALAVYEQTETNTESDRRPELQPESRPELNLTNKVLLLAQQELGKSELAARLGHKSVSGELNKQIRKLLQERCIEMTVPDKPTSRKQKYRLTAQGRELLQNS